MRQLGNKHTCQKCATKFYDLQAERVVCPVCSREVKSTAPIFSHADVTSITEENTANDNDSFYEELPLANKY